LGGKGDFFFFPCGRFSLSARKKGNRLYPAFEQRRNAVLFLHREGERVFSSLLLSSPPSPLNKEEDGPLRPSFFFSFLSALLPSGGGFASHLFLFLLCLGAFFFCGRGATAVPPVSFFFGSAGRFLSPKKTTSSAFFRAGSPLCS